MLTSCSHNSHSSRFAVDPGTGVLTVAATLDYESRQNYTLQVTADDQGTRRDGDTPLTDTKTFTVVVVDQNEPPYLSGSTDVLYISENARAGEEVGCVESAVRDQDVHREATGLDPEHMYDGWEGHHSSAGSPLATVAAP